MNPLHPFTKISADTPNFTWHEALHLPKWDLYHLPSGAEVETIMEFAKKMQAVRDLLGLPIIVHCWIRPRVANTRHPMNELRAAQRFHGEDYNGLVGGAKRSAHIYGNACDFHVDGMTIKDATEAILPHLERLGIRMERHDGPWIHLDSKAVGQSGERWFKP